MKRHERLEQETPHFTRSSLERAADIVECFDRPCLLENTELALTLEAREQAVTLLGVKDRARLVRGFKTWDVRRPAYMERSFDLVFCDAIDASLALRELRQAIRILTHFKPQTSLMIACPTSRKDSLLRVFADFNLEATGFRMALENTDSAEAEDIEIFANFDLPT